MFVYLCVFVFLCFYSPDWQWYLTVVKQATKNLNIFFESHLLSICVAKIWLQILAELTLFCH